MQKNHCQSKKPQENYSKKKPQTNRKYLKRTDLKFKKKKLKKNP